MRFDCKTGILSNCAGSSFFSCNNSTVYCTVNGPIDTQKQNKECILEIKWTESTILNHKQFDKYYSFIMNEILSLYILTDYLPYKTLYIDFHCLGEEFSLFCAVNSSLLALADACVPLKSLFYGLTSFTSNEEVIVYDDKVAYCHSFGKNCYLDGIKYLEEVKEHVDFALKEKNCGTLLNEKLIKKEI